MNEDLHLEKRLICIKDILIHTYVYLIDKQFIF